MQAKLLFLHALSPLHAGTGQGVDAIDLPIARERATALPFVPGSTLKGVVRDNLKGENADLIKRVFGPDTVNASDHASSVQFSDARLVLFPVRSLYGVFAWATSPYLLQRLLRDITDAGITDAPARIPPIATANQGNVVETDSKIVQNNKIFLEDLDIIATPKAEATLWANWLASKIFASDVGWQGELQKRFCILHDDTLNFLLQTATEITARIRLEADKKTVADGALWYEESLPTESILSGLVIANEVKAKPKDVFDLLDKLNSKTIQVGGKATVGRGLVQMHITGGK